MLPGLPPAGPGYTVRTGGSGWKVVAIVAASVVVLAGIGVGVWALASHPSPVPSNAPTSADGGQSGAGGTGTGTSSSGQSGTGQSGSGTSNTGSSDTGQSGSGDSSSTGASGPGIAIAAVPLSPQSSSAMTVVQSLATALADHDWDQARSVYSSLGDDDSLQNGYGGLTESTVIVTNAIDNGNATSTLTGAYVAWESVNGSERTSIYCIQWLVNPGSQQVVNQTNIDSPLVDYEAGNVDPTALVSVVSNQCS